MQSMLIKGVMVISAALAADAGIGNVQEKLMKQHGVSGNEMVLCVFSAHRLFLPRLRHPHPIHR